MLTRQLQRGSWGFEVYTLQTLLVNIGMGTFTPGVAFGPKTEVAVQKFQRINNITPSGIVGPLTRGKLNAIEATPGARIYYAALSCLGTDASPNDVAPDEYGCAETVWQVVNKANPGQVGFPLTVSTAVLEAQMSTYTTLYERTEEPEIGCIGICATGTGNGSVKNGHVWIYMGHGIWASNNSYTSKFEKNYTTAEIMARYVREGGFTLKFFKKKK